MTEKKILELAAQFDDDSPEFAMSTEAVIAFARALIEARLAESSDEPVGYLTYIEDAGMLFTQDEPERGVYEPVYARPQPKARLTGEEILETAVKAPPVHPCMVQGDVTLGYLRKSAIDFARAIERKIWEKAG